MKIENYEEVRKLMKKVKNADKQLLALDNWIGKPLLGDHDPRYNLILAEYPDHSGTYVELCGLDCTLEVLVAARDKLEANRTDWLAEVEAL